MNGKKGLLWLFPFCETKGDARDISRHEDLEGRWQEGGLGGMGKQVNLIMWAQNLVVSFSSKSNLWWILHFCVLHPIIFLLATSGVCFSILYSFWFCLFGSVYIKALSPCHQTWEAYTRSDRKEKLGIFCIGLCWSTTTKGGIFHKRDIPPHIEIKDHSVNYILKLKRIHLFSSRNSEQLFGLGCKQTCKDNYDLI